jgi:hypothetical protein
MKLRKIHASEWAWLGNEFDHVIDNNGTIDELFKQAQSLVIGHQIPLFPEDSILTQC